MSHQSDIIMNPVLSHALAVLSGIIIGVIGNFIATRLTKRSDQRDLKKSRKSKFEELREQMPGLISEMIKDLNDKEMGLCREFVILPSNKVPFNTRKQYYGYFESDHQNLQSKVILLEQAGFIHDITDGNTPKYRFDDDFVKLLLK